MFSGMFRSVSWGVAVCAGWVGVRETGSGVSGVSEDCPETEVPVAGLGLGRIGLDGQDDEVGVDGEQGIQGCLIRDGVCDVVAFAREDGHGTSHGGVFGVD